MLSFIEYITLIEGKADDFRAANPHLKFLSDAHAIRYGRGLSRMNDLPSDPETINNTLNAFDKHGSKLSGNLRDFNQHPSFEHVSSHLRPHIEKSKKEKEKKEIASSGVDVVHDDGEGTVVKHIKTPEAAQGSECSGTKWCVSSKKIDVKGNSVGARHFKNYEDTDGTGKGGKARMFVINTPDGKKYAHHEGEGDELGGIVRDEHDRPIPASEFIKKYPSVSKVKTLHDTKWGIHFNPNPTSEQFNKALDNDNISVRLAAIRHPKATPEHISKALENEHPDVRHAAIKHPKVTSEHISKALEDEDTSVRFVAIKHPKATSEHISKALQDKSKYIRLAAIEHPNATSEHISKALEDEDTTVRKAAIRHPNATSEHINKALQDDHPDVRREAQRRLQAAQLKNKNGN